MEQISFFSQSMPKRCPIFSLCDAYPLHGNENLYGIPPFCHNDSQFQPSPDRHITCSSSIPALYFHTAYRSSDDANPKSFVALEYRHNTYWQQHTVNQHSVVLRLFKTFLRSAFSRRRGRRWRWRQRRLLQLDWTTLVFFVFLEGKSRRFYRKTSRWGWFLVLSKNWKGKCASSLSWWFELSGMTCAFIHSPQPRSVNSLVKPATVPAQYWLEREGGNSHCLQKLKIRKKKKNDQFGRQYNWLEFIDSQCPGEETPIQVFDIVQDRLHYPETCRAGSCYVIRHNYASTSFVILWQANLSFLNRQSPQVYQNDVTCLSYRPRVTLSFLCLFVMNTRCLWLFHCCNEERVETSLRQRFLNDIRPWQH